VVKVRSRDAAEELAEVEPASKADLIRLERLVGGLPKTDLTGIEKRLLANGEAIDRLQEMVAQTPAAATYEFEIIRDSKGLIQSVIARPQQTQG